MSKNDEIKVLDGEVSKEVTHALHDYAKNLSLQQLNALELFLSGVKAKEIAEIVGVSEGTILNWRALDSWKNCEISIKDMLYSQASMGLAQRIPKALDVMDKIFDEEFDPKLANAAVQNSRLIFESASLINRRSGTEVTNNTINVDNSIKKISITEALNSGKMTKEEIQTWVRDGEKPNWILESGKTS